MQTKKIKPLLFSHLTINNEEDVRLCFKRRPKVGKSFTCNLETNYETMQININPITYVKVSKHIKSVQEFMVNGFFENPQSQWTQLRGHLSKISKNLSKVKTLFLERSQFVPEHLAEWLNMCLRCSNQITRIDIDITDQSDRANDNDEEHLYRLFSQIFRKVKLQALNLYGHTSKAPDLFAFAQYRSSKIEYISFTSGWYAEELSFKPDKIRTIWLTWRYNSYLVECDQINDDWSGPARGRTFDMCWKWKNEESQISMSLLQEIIGLWISGEKSHPRSSISDLANLLALQIDFPIRAEIFREILESFPSLSHLIGLKIYERFPISFEIFELCPQLVNQLLIIPKNLKTLSLDLDKIVIPIQNLTLLLKENRLKKLDLNMPLRTENDLDNLINLTKTLKDTKILSIKIPSSEMSLFHLKFDLLLSEVSDLKNLIKIKLVCFESKNLDIKAYLFERLLSQHPQLEVLKVRFMLQNESERYPLLTNVIQRAEGLIKLNIDVGEYLPNQVDFGQIGSQLKNLKQIEVLKLHNFDITKDHDLLELVKEVNTLRKLRKLKLGTVTNMTLECLTTVRKSLFSFSKITSFKLIISPQFYDVLRVISQYSETWYENETKFYGTRQGVELYRTQNTLHWRRLEYDAYDVYQFRRGRETGRGGGGRGGRYLLRGRPRVSWFKEF